MCEGTKRLKLHMATTPRHVMSAIAMAAYDTVAEHQIIVFDQKATDNHFLSVANQFLSQSNLFSKHLLLYKKSSERSKVQHRKYNFNCIAQFVSDRTPEIIYTGNDRRLEFQYLAQLTAGKSQCIYVDEGSGSYANSFGIDPITAWSDKYIDTTIKKLVYGRWFDHPPVLGASRWVHSSILCFPEQANYRLAQKPTALFDSQWMHHPQISSFLQLYASHLDIDLKRLAEINHLYILPGEAYIKDSCFNLEAYREKVIKQAKNDNVTVGVKYHPRQNGDPLGFTGLDVIEIPRSLPLEIFLPKLKLDKVTGDLSSALMSVRWLNPETLVVAEKYNDSKAVQHLLTMFEHIGIQVVESSS